MKDVQTNAPFLSPADHETASAEAGEPAVQTEGVRCPTCDEIRPHLDSSVFGPLPEFELDLETELPLPRPDPMSREAMRQELRVAAKMALHSLRYFSSGKTPVDELPEPARSGRRALSARPELWAKASSVARASANMIAERLSEDDEIFRDLLLDAVETVRVDLGYADASPLDRMGIEQAAQAWVLCEATRRVYIGVTMSQAQQVPGMDAWERRLAHAERRYQRALEAVARTRHVLSRVHRDGDAI